MKYGLFGGAFDPVHFGHLRCAQDILEMLRLDRICFMPAARPPLKQSADMVSFEDRFRMVELAIAGNDAFEASDLENRRPGLSYTIDTVRELLQEKGPNLYNIIGQDAFADIRKWKHWDILLASCHFVVMTRPGYNAGALEPALPSGFAGRYRYDASEDAFLGPEGKAILFRDVTFLDISSTDIRNRLRNGQSVRYLLPDAVRTYIAEAKLYAPKTDPS